MATRHTPVWKSHPSWNSAILTWALQPVNYSWTLAVVQGTSLIGALYWFQRPSSPGKAVVVLGLVAVVMTIRAEEHWSRTERIMWLVLALVLAVVETRAINNDRAEYVSNQASARLKEEKAFTGVLDQEQQHFQRTTEELMSFIEQQQTIIQDDAQIAAMVQPLTERANLKKEAIIFTRDARQFVASRWSQRLRNGASDSAQAMGKYDLETVKLFSQQFDTRRARLCQNFQKYGLFCENIYATPLVKISRFIEEIGDLASRL